MQKFAKGNLTYLTFEQLGSYPELKHAFSMRFGGVSEGFYSSLNLGFHTGDDPEKITENFIRFSDAVGIKSPTLVAAALTHDANVRIVTENDRGKGIFKPRDYEKTDAFITNCREVALTATYADCVPIFLYDPVKHAIGLVHSGWRGTVAGIASVTILAMMEAYGCNPADILVGIGPHIHSCCFETGTEVKEQFFKAITTNPCFGCNADSYRISKPGTDSFCNSRQYDLSMNNWHHISFRDGIKKYHISLETVIIATLLHSGIHLEHIETSGLCTCCHPDLFFSHRATGGKRGCLAGIISL